VRRQRWFVLVGALAAAASVAPAAMLGAYAAAAAAAAAADPRGATIVRFAAGMIDQIRMECN